MVQVTDIQTRISALSHPEIPKLVQERIDTFRAQDVFNTVVSDFKAITNNEPISKIAAFTYMFCDGVA